MTRRGFVSAEADAFVRFYGDDMLTVSMWRSYRCECGYTTTDAGAIYDHAAGCSQTEDVMCDHGFIGACAECDGNGQAPEPDAAGLTMEHVNACTLPAHDGPGGCWICYDYLNTAPSGARAE